MNKWLVIFFGLWAVTSVSVVTWGIVSNLMERV